MNIAFIGLGHMGLPMAINLMKAGHQVTGFDLQTCAVDAFTQAGGVPARSLQDAARNQDVIITMLQTGQQVQQVCFGDNGLFAASRSNALYIDCSSIDVQQSRDIFAQATKHNLIAVDAPVSGGVKGAVAATLTFMVGGTESAYRAVKPLLALMGKSIIHAGVAGSGQAAKICNNMILGVSMIAVSEAFLLASELGLTPQKLFEVVTQSSGQCWIMNQYVPVPDVLDNVPANHDYKAGFTVAMMLKDLMLSQQSAQSSGMKTPMTERATLLYQQLNDAGMSGLDFSAVIKILGSSV
jgi:3-hydroxyisobutyrate dehydrogenase